MGKNMKAKLGKKYKVYVNGHVFDMNSKFQFFLDDDRIVDFIFSRKWDKNELDLLLEDRPESFYKKMREFSVRLPTPLAKYMPDEEIEIVQPNIDNVYRSSLEERLRFISTVEPDFWRDHRVKNMIHKTLAEAFLILLGYEIVRPSNKDTE